MIQRFRVLILALLSFPAASALLAQPDGSDISQAIPIYFSQKIDDTVDPVTRRNQIYSLTVARGQQMRVVTTTSPGRGHRLVILAPGARTIASAGGFVVADTNANNQAQDVAYTASAAGTYFVWVAANTTSVNYKLEVNAVGTPIAVPNPPTAGCLVGRVDSITYSLQLIAAGLPDEVTIGGQKACASCTVKAPLYPEISNRLENALRSRINVEACYDSSGNIFQIKLAQ